LSLTGGRPACGRGLSQVERPMGAVSEAAWVPVIHAGIRSDPALRDMVTASFERWTEGKSSRPGGLYAAGSRPRCVAPGGA